MNEVWRARLVRHIRQMHRSAPANGEQAQAARLELQRLAAAIDRLQADMQACPQYGLLEEGFEQAHGPQSLEILLRNLEDLSAAARLSVRHLPAAQSRPALAFAAAAWAHFRSFELDGKPPKSIDASEVKALQTLCEEAGLHRSADAYRKALGRALDAFDPHCPPPELQAFLALLGRSV